MRDLKTRIEFVIMIFIQYLTLSHEEDNKSLKTKITEKIKNRKRNKSSHAFA